MGPKLLPDADLTARCCSLFISVFPPILSKKAELIQDLLAPVSINALHFSPPTCTGKVVPLEVPITISSTDKALCLVLQS